MQTWEEMSRKEQLAAEHYDFYKDVHGISPRWMNYDAMSEAELEAELDSLAQTAEVVFAEEAAAERQAVDKFEQRVTDTIHMGAQNRDTALRWIMEGSEAGGDWEYFCYQNGLPYGYFRDEPVRSQIEAHEYAERAADLDAISFAQQGV